MGEGARVNKNEVGIVLKSSGNPLSSRLPSPQLHQSLIIGGMFVPEQNTELHVCAEHSASSSSIDTLVTF